MSNRQTLSCAVEAINETAGPNGLVPTLLVFGVFPRIPLLTAELPSQVQRMNAMASARQEASRPVARSCLRKALRSAPPSGLSNLTDLAIDD